MLSITNCLLCCLFFTFERKFRLRLSVFSVNRYIGMYRAHFLVVPIEGRKKCIFSIWYGKEFDKLIIDVPSPKFMDNNVILHRSKNIINTNVEVFI